MKYEKADIEKMLPHTGAMVLLDSVLAFDHARILCSTSSHLDSDNPLLCEGELSIFAGIEYAAQAMAVHNYLNSQQGSDQCVARQGVVAVASKLETSIERLDAIDQVVHIEVNTIDRTGDSSLYDFNLQAASKELISGRLLVMLT